MTDSAVNESKASYTSDRNRTEIKMGAGEILVIFWSFVVQTESAKRACVCMCLHDERKTEEEVMDYVWIMSKESVEEAGWRICGCALVVVKAEDRCVSKAAGLGSGFVCVCLCVSLAAVCSAQSGLGSVSLL